MELTSEYLDQQLSKLATKTDLEKQTKELKNHAVQLQEELARMVNDGFDDMRERLDVTAQLQTFERKFQKLEEALHIKL